ncbi:V-type proton ATPase subunit G-like [Sycon ciliatum]|uniref:V-type proton ATPase subunit G-like n=1 Tax=Sycon ciliatum TaxID=27933 RepID=UPI0020AA6AAD|eukprot:scpid77686/ scgid18181/ V-type proton ATPase subunit G; V-ATPase 13 kDa subunit; Vacuolar proton pump subunit G
MAQQSQGIQKLLAAEKQAAEIVDAARKRKTRRLKQAKEEAAQDIENYRQEREKNFRDQHAKNQGSGDSFAQQVDQTTRQQLSTVTQQVGLNKDAVMARLLDLITDVQPTVHQNLQT